MTNKIDIFQSVKSKAINDLSPELLETGLDFLIKSEALKDIPIFGIGFKTFSLYQNITESFFTKKLLKFLYELKDIPQIDREKFINELELKNETNKAGEKLLITLNRLSDVEKAEIIGRLLKNTILGKIEFSVFSRLSHIVDNAYFEDLNLLKDNLNLRNISNDVKSNLHQVGLLNQTISDTENQRRFLDRVGSSRDVQPTLEYTMNNYCEILIENGFN